MSPSLIGVTGGNVGVPNFHGGIVIADGHCILICNRVILGNPNEGIVEAEGTLLLRVVQLVVKRLTEVLGLLQRRELDRIQETVNGSCILVHHK